MGRLIDQERRRRARSRRGERRILVLQAAADLFGRLPWEDVTLDLVDRKAGVPEGTSSLHFGSREELFLKVVRVVLGTWYEGLEEALGERDGELDPEGVASLLTRRLLDGGSASRVLALLPLAFEHLHDLSAVVGLAAWMEERRAGVGAAIEERCPRLRGRGALLVEVLELLAAGSFGPLFAGGAAAMARGAGEAGARERLATVALEVFRSVAAGAARPG